MILSIFHRALTLLLILQLAVQPMVAAAAEASEVALLVGGECGLAIPSSDGNLKEYIPAMIEQGSIKLR